MFSLFLCSLLFSWLNNLLHMNYAALIGIWKEAIATKDLILLVL